MIVEDNNQHKHDEKLQIIEPLQDFFTREGQSARFTCKITGSGKF